MIMNIIQTTTYYLSEHPTIKSFRWSPSQTYGSTWSFLITSITLYILLSLLLHLLIRRPIPLGPIPALHSLLMAALSFTIFSGILLSASSEIRDTRWFWRRTSTSSSAQWLLCFPLGTRPSGRVFFWSYAFYASRFLHLLRTFFSILGTHHRSDGSRGFPFHHLLNHSIIILSSFLWLEFSQSFQVLAIVSTTLVSSVVYGYRFWTAVGLPAACFPFVLNCQIVLLGCNLVCHVGVLLMHLLKGGCNGIGAWGFNSVLNAAVLLLFLNFYIKRGVSKRSKIASLEKVKDC